MIRVMRPLSFAAALVFFGFLSFGRDGIAVAQIAPRHVPPSDTTVPVGARLLLQVLGEGVQIYDCTLRNKRPAWDFHAPEAKLLDPATHEQLGIHGAGPMWRWKDGSALSGKVVVSQVSQEAGSVPWLLLAATPLGDRKGMLTPVVWVRRSETHGGIAPISGCDANHVGRTERVRYGALYTFYSVDPPTGR